MRKKSMIVTVFAAISLLVMILDSKRALMGAQEGLSLCIRSVIPSLLPFLFFSSILTEGTRCANAVIMRPLSWLWRIPKGAESILLVGLLGGYPTGAHSVTSAYEQGRISKTTAQRMLSFSNNCGPAFIFGILGNFFEKPWETSALWVIHLLSSAIVSRLMPQSGGITPAKETESIRPDHLLKRSLSVIAQICGWVILFRMLITFIDEWFGFIIPISVQPLLYGLLEITNGCLSLHLIPDSGVRFIICSVMLAMGGFCVTMQTASIISQDLKLSHYCFGKLMQAAISAALSAFVAVTFIQHKAIYLYPLFFPMFFFILALILRKSKNNSRFLPATVV